MSRGHRDGQEWLSRLELRTWLNDLRIKPQPCNADCDALIDQLRQIWNHAQSAAVLRRSDPLALPVITELKDVSLAVIVDPLSDALAAEIVNARQSLEQALCIAETVQDFGGAPWRGGGTVFDLIGVIKEVNCAIAELDAPLPADAPGRGRPTTGWHMVARPFAVAIRDALLAAGFKPEVQRHQRDAVSYVGAKAISRVAGEQITEGAFEAALRGRVRRKHTYSGPSQAEGNKKNKPGRRPAPFG
jgi:hypothetical protein